MQIIFEAARGQMEIFSACIYQSIQAIIKCYFSAKTLLMFLTSLKYSTE